MTDSEIAAHEAVAEALRGLQRARAGTSSIPVKPPAPKEAARRPPASRHASSIDFPTHEVIESRSQQDRPFKVVKVRRGQTVQLRKYQLGLDGLRVRKGGCELGAV